MADSIYYQKETPYHPEFSFPSEYNANMDVRDF